MGNLITLVLSKVHNQIVRHGWTDLIILVSFATFLICVSAPNVSVRLAQYDIILCYCVQDGNVPSHLERQDCYVVSSPSSSRHCT